LFLPPALFDGDSQRLFPTFEENFAAGAKCHRLPLPRTRLIRLRPDLSRGLIRCVGKKPLLKEIDMSGDPACVKALYGNALNRKAGAYYV
jgi:hypothetical protein